MTKTELRQAVISEHAEGFTYDDAYLARVLQAIDSTLIDEVNNFDGDLDDVDETTLEGAALVALTIEFHYGNFTPLTG